MLLKVEDYYPIDRDKVKKCWDKIMNVPNDQWNIERVADKIEIINTEWYPYTLRTAMLNLLPAIVIEILKTITYANTTNSRIKN